MFFANWGCRLIQRQTQTWHAQGPGLIWICLLGLASGDQELMGVENLFTAKGNPEYEEVRSVSICKKDPFIWRVFFLPANSYPPT